MMGQVSAPDRAYVRTERRARSCSWSPPRRCFANLGWSTTYARWWHTELAVSFGDAAMSLDLRHWVNHGLIVPFFFGIGFEVRREASVGELRRPGHAALPLLAGVVGLLIPALFYLIANPTGDASNGWGAVVSTDIAFMLGAPR